MIIDLFMWQSVGTVFSNGKLIKIDHCFVVVLYRGVLLISYRAALSLKWYSQMSFFSSYDGYRVNGQCYLDPIKLSRPKEKVKKNELNKFNVDQCSSLIMEQ